MSSDTVATSFFKALHYHEVYGQTSHAGSSLLGRTAAARPPPIGFPLVDVVLYARRAAIDGLSRSTLELNGVGHGAKLKQHHNQQQQYHHHNRLNQNSPEPTHTQNHLLSLDHQSNPLLVISASSFPAKLPGQLKLDSLTQQALSLFSPIISNGPYSLIIFASPADHAPTINRFYLPTDYSVFLKTIVSWKMSRKIHWVKDLSTLASLVPIHQFKFASHGGLQVQFDHRTLYHRPTLLSTTPVFQVSLEQLMGSDGLDGIPQVIQDCANCIRSSGMKFEGLFRRPPSLTTTQIIRDAYDRRQPVKMEDYSDGPFLAASLIKLFLRELPEPIFSAEFYPIFRACPSIINQPIISKSHHSDQLHTNNLTVLQYVQDHVLKNLKSKAAHILLDYVLKLCHDLALHSVTEPSLFTKNPPDPKNQNSEEPTSFSSILKFMISCYPLLFDEPQEPISPTCSSLSSSSAFKDSHSTIRSSAKNSPRTARTSSIYEQQDSKNSDSKFLQKLFSARRPLSNYNPLRCTISQVGLSHATFSLADRRTSRLFLLHHQQHQQQQSQQQQGDNSAGLVLLPCRDPKMRKFGSLQGEKIKKPLGVLPPLSDAFTTIPSTLPSFDTCQSTKLDHSPHSSNNTHNHNHISHVSSGNMNRHSRFLTHSSDLNELD
ncbi:hypothetical protein H4Q26_016848 [Puccinia striiformis f. sp. tritici PST-130]|nr:hypothetical protein H4Q26_016848 [Puccinia striiformis f. sp. tritici PST-130]